MRSIFENIALQDFDFINESNIQYLIVEQADMGSALKNIAGALKDIQGSLSSLPKTQALIGKSVIKLTDSIPDLEGDDEEAKKEAQALFLLAAQFGSAFSRFLNSTIDIVNLKDPALDSAVIDALGGQEKIAGNIEKFFIPSLSALEKASKALQKLTIEPIKSVSKSLKTAVFGKKAAVESKISLDHDINEGIFGDMAGKLSSFVRSLAKPPDNSKTTISNLEKLFGANIAKAIYDDLSSKDLTIENLKNTIESLKSSLPKISSEDTKSISRKEDKKALETPEDTKSISRKEDKKASETPEDTKSISNISKDAINVVASELKDDPEVDKETKKALDLAAAGDSAWKEAYSDLEKNQKDFFDKLLSSLASKKEPDVSEIDSAIQAARSELALDYESELDILDDILTSKQIKQVIKVAGPKVPKFIDSKLAGDEELRKALQLAGRKRRGHYLNESPISLKTLLYEDAVEISQDILDKLMAGGDAVGLDSEKSKKIADILISAGQEKKRIKKLESQLNDLKAINDVLRSEKSEEIKKSKEYDKAIETMLGNIVKTREEAESLLKDKKNYEIKIKELEQKNSQQAKDLAKSMENLAQKAEEISGIEAELQMKSDLDQNLPTLSSILLTGDKTKGYKLKSPEELDAQANSFIRTLSNISGADGSWERFSKSQKSSNKKDLFDKLKSLKQVLDKIKIESKEDNKNLIIERWQRLAGLEE